MKITISDYITIAELNDAKIIVKVLKNDNLLDKDNMKLFGDFYLGYSCDSVRVDSVEVVRDITTINPEFWANDKHLDVWVSLTLEGYDRFMRVGFLLSDAYSICKSDEINERIRNKAYIRLYKEVR